MVDTFEQFIDRKLLNEIGPDPMGGGMGGPPGGGMGGMGGPPGGGIGGADPMGGMGMAPPIGGGMDLGMGGGGAMGGGLQQPQGTEKIRATNVWEVLEKLLKN